MTLVCAERNINLGPFDNRSPPEYIPSPPLKQNFILRRMCMCSPVFWCAISKPLKNLLCRWGCNPFAEWYFKIHTFILGTKPFLIRNAFLEILSMYLSSSAYDLEAGIVYFLPGRLIYTFCQVMHSTLL